MIESVSLVSLDARKDGEVRNHLFCTCVFELLEAQGHHSSSSMETHFFSANEMALLSHIFKLYFSQTYKLKLIPS